MIKGQDKVLSKLFSFSLDTMPHSIILEGKNGSGRKTTVKDISEKFGLKLLDITSNISLDIIEDALLSPIPTMYMIDSDDIGIREQNILLKFLEEPLKGSYITIITTKLSSLLQTVQNRCQIVQFSPYSKEFLTDFLTDKSRTDVIEYAETPGQVIEYESQNMSEIVNLCYKIVASISVASFPNTLTISNKIAFKKDEKGIPVNLFFKVMTATIRKTYISNNGNLLVQFYRLTEDTFNTIDKSNSINKKWVFENYLIKLKECTVQ